jgi:hypothetical protein
MASEKNVASLSVFSLEVSFENRGERYYYGIRKKQMCDIMMVYDGDKARHGFSVFDVL